MFSSSTTVNMFTSTLLFFSLISEAWLTPEKCNLPGNILNKVFNNVIKDKENYGVEGAIGVVGTHEEILSALQKIPEGVSYTLKDLEPCIPKAPPAHALPSTGVGATNILGYFSPGVGHMPVVETPYPFDYAGGYSTYQNPYLMGMRVPGYRPNAYRRATNLTEFLVELYYNLQKRFREFFEGPSKQPKDSEENSGEDE